MGEGLRFALPRRRFSRSSSRSMRSFDTFFGGDLVHPRELERDEEVFLGARRLRERDRDLSGELDFDIDRDLERDFDLEAEDDLLGLLRFAAGDGDGLVRGDRDLDFDFEGDFDTLTLTESGAAQVSEIW
eukprot:CAMPEP_0117850790 /NCGR_PEP_ID=MMETSP0949-20121206/21899_1 /TAXON_ID=44440 /ORGANISM="Chattonella subsalsa, Strain CCMP2191" /LENGTH=129 /DNA_ID=CAMNT_0005698255 /DNA_START=1277 /DNA_END=1663 /DNA_ORIENTATION=+